ncbi:hypothetical protein P7C70_g9306, partial [Phenoliferia sp. Uapishka_3]
MSTITLSLPKEPTPASRTLSLISSVYGQYVPDFVVSPNADSLSLTSPSEPTISNQLYPIASKVLTLAGKVTEMMGKDDEQKKEVESWLKRIESGEFDKEESLKVSPEQPLLE